MKSHSTGFAALLAAAFALTLIVVKPVHAGPGGAADVDLTGKPSAGLENRDVKGRRLKSDREILGVDCDTMDTVVAATNGVPTTIRAPANVGECVLFLSCQNEAGEETGLTDIEPGKGLHSYSCGADASKIVMDCIAGLEADDCCKLSYVP